MFLQNEARCPYCSGELAKPPSRKAKCPHCGEFYLVRTRPEDRAKVIVTAQEADALEQEWTLRSTLGSAEEWEQRLQRVSDEDDPWERFELEAMIARARRQYDKAWRKFNQARMTAAQYGAMGIYRNLTMAMSEQLWVEGRRKQALAMLLEVHYYDLCGATNAILDVSGPAPKAVSRIWNRSEAFLAPGLVARTREWVADVALEEGEFRTLALQHLKAAGGGMAPPLTSEQALPTIVEIAYSDKPTDQIQLPKVTRSKKSRQVTDRQQSPQKAPHPGTPRKGPAASPKATTGCAMVVLAAVLVTVSLILQLT